MQQNRMRILAAFTLLSFVIFGCAEEHEGENRNLEVIESSVDDKPPSPKSISEATPQGRVLASLKTPTGSQVDFIEVQAGDEASVLVLERGQTVVMDQILNYLGDNRNASDLFVALAGAIDSGTSVPARLEELVGPPSNATQLNDWNTVLLAEHNVAATPIDLACDNSSFTSSTPGGPLNVLWTRLDNGPSTHPELWADGQYHFYYQAEWLNLTQWRGKLCGQRYTTEITTRGIGFFTSLLGSQGGFVYFNWDPLQFHSTTYWYAWYWNGPGTADWRIAIYANADDYYDILMWRP